MKTLSIGIFCLSVASLTAFGDELDRGVDLYNKNHFSDAVPVLRKVVEEDEGNARANRYLGLALVEQGKTSEGEPFLTKANELDPGGESKSAMARLYVELKDYDKAEATLADAEGDAVAYVRGLLNLGRKQYDAAARDLESFSQSHPDHAYAHYYAGMAYNGMRRPDKMLTHFELFLKMKPDAPEARKVQSVLRSVR